MKAVVLVGGEGTRMRPLTQTTPKPLIPFMNRPFLHTVLDRLAAHGVGEVILSSPYLENEFRGFLEERRDLSITWITEETPLGTAGAVAGARDHLDETFFVLNGDVLTDLDLTSLAAFHRASAAVGTIALTRVEDVRPFGLVETDADGRVAAFREKPAEAIPGDVNAGTYVLEPEALDGIAAGIATSIERETFPGLIARGGRLFAMVSGGYWRDLGTPAAYLAAHEDALLGRVGGPYPRPYLAEGVRLEEDAEVGELVVAAEGALVAAGARVDRSVLHAGARVETGARVEDSILGPGSEVGPEARVSGAVLGAGARVKSGADAGPGTRVGPAETFG